MQGVKNMLIGYGYAYTIPARWSEHNSVRDARNLGRSDGNQDEMRAGFV